MNKYVISLNDDQLIEVRLFEALFTRERIPLIADNSGLLYEIGEFLNVWMPSGEFSLIDPDRPPLLLNGGRELIQNSQPKISEVKRLYNIAKDLGELNYIDDNVVSIYVADKFKYENITDYTYKNEWLLYTEKDYLEYVRDAFRNQYKGGT